MKIRPAVPHLSPEAITQEAPAYNPDAVPVTKFQSKQDRKPVLWNLFVEVTGRVIHKRR